MNKPIKKIKTKPDLPKLKFGDIVQFDYGVPVKVVKYKECENCIMEIHSLCSKSVSDICALLDTEKNKFMFAEVKDE